MNYSGKIFFFLPHLLRTVFLFLVLHYSVSNTFSADIYIQIQRGEKVSIGFPDFISKGHSESEKLLTQELQETTKRDILFTRLFDLTEGGEGTAPSESGRIDFSSWEKIGADLLLITKVNFKEDLKKKGDGTVQMIASVFEVSSSNPVFQKSYRASRVHLRHIAHEFVADFLFRFTGNRGASQSKIVFSNNGTGYKELYLIDYDGGNLKRITSDKSINLLARWSPDGTEILYTTYRNGNPDSYIYSLEQGKSRAISVRKGLNSCASFSPNGKEIVLTLSYQGAPNLYLLDRQGKIVRRLTQIHAADTSPSFSPDGRRILFTSDRPGWPQIYMMDVDGSNMKRLTESGYCDSPVWSPNGDKIAYSKGTESGQQDIVIQDLMTGEILVLTENAGKNENPSFSPDGKFLVFTSTRNKKRELFIASIDGTIQKKVAEIRGDCFSPFWGP